MDYNNLSVLKKEITQKALNQITENETNILQTSHETNWVDVDIDLHWSIKKAIIVSVSARIMKLDIHLAVKYKITNNDVLMYHYKLQQLNKIIKELSSNLKFINHIRSVSHKAFKQEVRLIKVIFDNPDKVISLESLPYLLKAKKRFIDDLPDWIEGFIIKGYFNQKFNKESFYLMPTFLDKYGCFIKEFNPKVYSISQAYFILSEYFRWKKRQSKRLIQVEKQNLKEKKKSLQIQTLFKINCLKTKGSSTKDALLKVGWSEAKYYRIKKLSQNS